MEAPDDNLLVSHDLFGDGSTEDETVVYRSGDKGATWDSIARIRGQWWSTLFAHREALYLIGTSRRYGDLIIRRSDDGGATWSTPDTGHGLLARGSYHSAPTAVVRAAGRIWKVVEVRDRGPGEYAVVFASVREEADLLDPLEWALSSPRSSPLGRGWLEGNAVVFPEGGVGAVVRTRPGPGPETAALVHPSGSVQEVSMPGGAKKFTARWDPVLGRYIALTNPARVGGEDGEQDVGRIRNRLCVVTSPDLQTWRIREVVVEHPDWRHTGYQYADWVRVGEFLAVVIRTSYRRPVVAAKSAMASNALTFCWLDLS